MKFSRAIRQMRPSRRAVSAVSLVLFAATFIVAAMNARGFPAADVVLHDGGIWVTNRDQGYFGRFNRPIEQLDAALSPGTSGVPDIDVLQSDADVFLIDRNAGLLRKVSVAEIELSSSGPAIPDNAQAAMGGGVVAVIDRGNGNGWIRTTDRIVDLDISVDIPDFTVGGEAAVAVGVDGVVHAVSAAEDRIMSFRPDGTVDERRIGQDMKKSEIAAVGADPVVLDTSGQLVLPDKIVRVSGNSPRLQQTGAGGAGVLVATKQELLEFDLKKGSAARLAAGSGGEPAAPVRVGSCVHGAWEGATYVRRCDTTTSPAIQLTDLAPDPELVFRVNRDAVVLNDVASGSIYLFDRGGGNIADWQKAIEQAKQQPEESNNPEEKDVTKNTPPKAVDDSFGARPGQATLLHVLDNDSDPDGDLLVVQSFTAVKPPGAGRLAIVNNGQALQYLAAPSERDSSVRFKYTVDDGKGGKSSANVVVEVRRGGNNPPVLREPPEPLVVQQGGSVGSNVLRNWRDQDGDPLALVSAITAEPDRVHFGPDGELTFTAAPGSTGAKTVQLKISDGEAEVDGELSVTVVDRDMPPQAYDDLESGIAGETISIHPLNNDTDPNTTVPGGEQRLRLSFVSPGTSGITVTPDYLAGTIAFKAVRPGTFYVTYKITDGRGESEARVRVDVRSSSSEHEPVAMADNAVLYGDAPATVDVLGNDVDLDGDVLLVSTVQVPANSGLSVAVIEHRWLRITAAQTNVGAERESVRYTISDGLHQDTGQVTVTRRPLPPDNQPPVARPDVATARAGDVVTIDVLGNDFDPDGGTMSLDPRVVPDDATLGTWMGAGGVIRFHAPQTAGSIAASYTVRDERGAAAVGQVTVVVVPATAPNQIPQPPPIQARVFAGSKIRLDIPLTGVDPDGDSVVLLGPAHAPGLGRIVQQGLDHLEFEAYPGTGGTDVFTYHVVDPFGGRGTGTVRIGVVPQPERNSAPVAVDDVLIVAPGTTVRAPVMVNDSDVDNDPLRLETLELANALVPSGVSLTDDRVVMTSGPLQGDVVSVRYSISDGRGQRATASLTLVAQDGANLPPLARDDEAKGVPKGATTVDVDVLANDDDIDGHHGDLKITAIDLGETAKSVVTEERQLRITLTERPRQVAYQIADPKGGVAVAFVRVPGTANLPPQPRPDAPPLLLPSGGELIVDVPTLLTDPEGGPIRITAASAVSASPPLGVTLVPESVTESQFKVIAAAEYVGPASAVFEATDGQASVSISVPITVTPPAGTPPVLNCPPVEPIAGAPAVVVDLPRCVTKAVPGDLTFSDLSNAPPGITAELRGGQLLVSAASGAEVGDRGKVRLRVIDAAGAVSRGEIGIMVQPSGLPVANTDTLDGVKAGSDVRIDITANDTNPFPAVPLKAVEVTQVSGPPVSFQVDGDGRHVVIRPTAIGQATLNYRVRDATGARDREVVGLIVVNVIDRPAPPGQPIVRTVGDKYAILAWTEPASNGAPITSYEVSGNGFSQKCSVTVCQLDGLTNGTVYTFSVTAVNAAGKSDPSPPSLPANPDAKPGRPNPPLTQFGDASISLTWEAPPTNGGTPIEAYEIEVSPPAGGGTKVAVGTSLVWTGLQNGVAYSFRVRARNSNLVGDWSGYSAPEIPARPPNEPAPPTAAPVVDGIGEQIRVNWEPPSDNGGAPIIEYRVGVIRSGEYERTITLPGGTTEVTVHADNGREYRFIVAALNKAGLSHESGQSATVVAHGDPFPVREHSYSEEYNGKGADRRVTYDLERPDDNGMAITRYEFDVNGDGAPDATGTSTSGFVTGLTNGVRYTIRVRACNTGCGDWSGPGDSVTPYGPVPTPTATAVKEGEQQIRLSWAPNGTNGRPLSRIEIRLGSTGPWERVGTSAGSRVVGTGYNQTHCIQVRAYDSERQVSTIASACATTDPPPPPPPPA